MPDSPPPDPVTQAIDNLRAFHKEGAASLEKRERRIKRDPDAARHGNKIDLLKAEARAEGTNVDTLQKRRAVAEQYAAEDIEALCELVRAAGAPFGPTHLTRLLAVKDRRTRDTLTRQAIKDKWSVGEVKRVVQAACGVQRQGGRRPKVPKGRRQLMADLVAKCTAWERWCKTAGPRLPAGVKELTDQATRAIARVRAAASDQLPAPRPVGKSRRTRGKSL
jgi:hypothetical protein